MLSLVDILLLEPKAKLYRVPVGDKGLFVQVAPNGLQSWVFRSHGRAPLWRDMSITVGRVSTMSLHKAKAQAALLAGQVAAGIDPVATKRAAKALARTKVTKPVVPTMADIGAAYLQDAEGRLAASWMETVRWYFKQKINPALGIVPVDQVTPQVITRFLDSLRATPVQANKIRSVLSKMFTWATRRIEALAGKPNPVVGHERNQEHAREVRLTEDQIRQVGEALRDGTGWGQKAWRARWAIVLIMLTGARRGAVMCMAEEHQHPDEHLIRFPARLPGAKGTRLIYLCAAACKVLPQVPLGLDRENLRGAWRKLCPPGCNATLHDLRRTFASVGADLGHDEAVIDALLGHSRGKLRDTYVRRADGTLLGVADQIGSHIAHLLGLQ